MALITQARLEHEFGASRARIWLERVHHVRVATETIQLVFRDIGVPHLVKTRRRRPKQLKLFEKEHPGDSVKVDVKVIARGRTKWFQYTAIDACMRVRVLRLYRRQNHRSNGSRNGEANHNATTVVGGETSGPRTGGQRCIDGKREGQQPRHQGA